MTIPEIRDKALATGGILAPSEVLALASAVPANLDRSRNYGLRIIHEIRDKSLVRTEERGGDTYWLWDEDADDRLTVLVNWFFIEEFSR